MQVTLVDPINKHKVAIGQITRLLSSIIDKKTILPKFMVVMIEEIFTLEAIEPFVHQMIDLGASQLETKLGTIVFWSFKFIRIYMHYA